MLSGLRVQDFYEDIFEELAKFGEVQNLNVCDNLADHMVGSVYAKVRRCPDRTHLLVRIRAGYTAISNT